MGRKLLACVAAAGIVLGATATSLVYELTMPEISGAATVDYTSRAEKIRVYKTGGRGDIMLKAGPNEGQYSLMSPEEITQWLIDHNHHTREEADRVRRSVYANK